MGITVPINHRRCEQEEIEESYEAGVSCKKKGLEVKEW